MISQKSKYALRALSALSHVAPGETLRIATIAVRETIPKKFLEQILLDLKRAGLVESRRGQKGGYFLLRHPAEIAVGEVLRAIEGPFLPLTCLGNGETCADCRAGQRCVVRQAFLRVAAASARILEATMLAEVFGDPAGMPGEGGGRTASGFRPLLH